MYMGRFMIIEWIGDYFLAPSEHLASYMMISWREQVTFWCDDDDDDDDDDDRFGPDQHAELDLYNASSLK
jgi:hypothetical protein